MGGACLLEESLQIADGWCVSRDESGREVERSWIALKVNTRSESLVSQILETRGYETFSPTISERRKYSDRFKTVEVAVLPGYVLSYWNDGPKTPILSCPGVKYIVSFGGQLATISDQTVDGLRRMITNGAHPVPYFRSGELVRVESGLLSGIEGRYMRRGSTGTLVVSVDILERSVALHIDDDRVELVSRPSLPGTFYCRS